MSAIHPPLSRLLTLACGLVVLSTACRTLPKPGDDPLPDGADTGPLSDDTGDVPDTGSDDSSDGGGDSGGDDTGSGDGGTGDSGSGDSGSGDGGTGDSGSGDGGTGDSGGDTSDGGEGEDGGEGGEGTDGGSSSSDPEEICNGVDDDGDGEIDEDACDDEVVTDPSTGRAYMVVETSMMWFDAAAYCTSYGYNLVTIDDDTENDFVWELIFDGSDGVHTANSHTWIGLHEDVGASWAWHDGTATGGYDASGSVVIEDVYGTVTYGQAMAFGDEDTATWFEAPQTWYHASVCESP
jgi:hypothetical protein